MLATGLLVAGYGFMLSLGRDPLAVPSAPPPSATIAHPEGVRPLPPHEDLRAFAMDAAARLGHHEDSLTKHVVRVVTGTAPPEDGGVATFSTQGSKLHWHPFSEFQETGTGALELSLDLPQGPVALTVARSRAEARRRYLACVDLAATPEREPETVFDLTTPTTRLFLPMTVASAGPFRLVRVGYPEWQPPSEFASGVVVRRWVELRLGPGDYVLVDPIDESARQRFPVPSPDPIRVEPSR